MLLTMTDNELQRIKVIQDICDKRITGVEAARLLRLSTRQIHRLIKRFTKFGSSGLISLKRGNRRHSDSLKLRVLSLLHEHYADFGPTLAHEKLTERHDIHVSVETLRQWMIADGLWVPSISLVFTSIVTVEHLQIDGYHHDFRPEKLG